MTKVETEHKYLVKMPRDFGGLQFADIAQTYLVGFEGTARVRVWKQGETERYVFTEKRRLSALSALESEREIDKQTYEQFLQRADPTRRTVHKRRYLYPYNDQIFEIDVYPFWQKQCVMEVELSSEEERVDLPPDIEILREVTEDKRYKNVMLAQCVPEEEAK